jgi:hypothetical protein
MAEYDKGRLYWIKLTDRFISSDTVDFLMSQKDGANYVVLYQMLCLKTVNNGGLLARELGEILVPYDVEKIQRDCKWFSIDTVRIALGLYKKLGLIYENNDGILAITNFDRLIGSQTYGAEKKALQRQIKEDNLLQGGQRVDNCPPEKDIEKEEDKEKEIHSFVHSSASEDEVYLQKKVNESGLEGLDAEVYKAELKEGLKQTYLGGSLGQGVLFMSNEQFSDLCDKLTYDELNKYCGIVTECEKSGKRYKKKSHYQAILDMVKADRKIR